MLTNVYATGNVKGYGQTAGLIGDMIDARFEIINAVSLGDVQIVNNGTYYNGAFCGDCGGKMINVAAAGNVTGNNGAKVGAAAGWLSGSITNGYFAGTLSGTEMGAIVGVTSGEVPAKNVYYNIASVPAGTGLAGNGGSVTGNVQTFLFNDDGDPVMSSNMKKQLVDQLDGWELKECRLKRDLQNPVKLPIPSELVKLGLCAN